MPDIDPQQKRLSIRRHVCQYAYRNDVVQPVVSLVTCLEDRSEVQVSVRL